MSDDSLAKALNTAITVALDEVSKQQKMLSSNLLDLEHERLFKLVGDWLGFEIEYWGKTRNEMFEIFGRRISQLPLNRNLDQMTFSYLMNFFLIGLGLSLFHLFMMQ